MESKYIDLVINRLTQAQYDELKRNNQVNEEELYDIIDHDDLFYYKTQLYTKDELNTKFSEISEALTELENNVNENVGTQILTIQAAVSGIIDTYVTKKELAEFSPVEANPTITGTEEVLDSITIDGVDYRVYPEGSIEFSSQKSSDSDAYTLRSITVGSDIWNLPEGGSGGSGGASSEELLNLSNQVGNLSSELQLKANTSDVYNKTEIDAMLSEGVGGSNVIANVELDGGEEILESIQIEDTKYSLQGQDMTFSEGISENPDAKILKTITIGTDDWKVDKGSVVTPNVELTGDEPVLESVQIDDATFTLKGEEMIFSETAVAGATPLRSITLGDDVWGIPEGGGKVDLSEYYTKNEIDEQFSEFSPVSANPVLTGSEQDLEGISINGVNYSVLSDEITFSESSKTGYSLKSITVGNTVWSIEGGSVSEEYATEEYVDNRVANLVNSAPSTLDTLGELAIALQQNQSVVNTLDSAITNKLDASKIVYSETEPTNPVVGMIWLKPAQ